MLFFFGEYVKLSLQNLTESWLICIHNAKWVTHCTLPCSNNTNTPATICINCVTLPLDKLPQIHDDFFSSHICGSVDCSQLVEYWVQWGVVVFTVTNFLFCKKQKISWSAGRLWTHQEGIWSYSTGPQITEGARANNTCWRCSSPVSDRNKILVFLFPAKCTGLR